MEVDKKGRFGQLDAIEESPENISMRRMGDLPRLKCMPESSSCVEESQRKKKEKTVKQT